MDRHHADRPRNQAPRAHALERMHVPVLDRVTRYPKAVLTVAGLATAASLWAIPHVGFDYNLLNLQAKGTESVMWEKRILANTGRSGFNGLASATTLEELRRKQEAFEKLPSVSEVDSVLRVIPDNQKEKIAIVRDLRAHRRAGARGPLEPGRHRPAGAGARRAPATPGHLRRRGRGQAARRPQAAPDADDGPASRRSSRPSREVSEPALTHLQSQLYRDFIDQVLRACSAT